MARLFWGFALTVFTFSGVFQVKANPINDLVEGATSPSNYFVFGQIKTYYELVDQLDNKQLELELLKKSQLSKNENITSLTNNLTTLEAQVSALEANIYSLENQTEPTENQALQIAAREAEKAELENQITELERELKKLNQTYNTDTATLRTLEEEIDSIQTDLSKSQLKIKSYAESFVKKFVLVLGIWLVSILLKWVAAFVFNRLDFYLSPQRKAFILQLIRLSINALAVIATLLVFFSQLMQALPYFAIFATALAFALRDVILSVIAWLIIGTKDGYKVGHYLHIGTLWGTVVEINPFNTIVRQGGMSGQTGRLLTFPNKKIFEEFLENWSKLFNYTFLKWDFFLEQGSDVEKAEAILLSILETEQAKYKESIAKKRPQLIKKGLTDEDLEPRIFWEIQANGILLRGKLLVDFNDFFAIRSSVTRAFIIKINQEKNIQLRFVNNLLPNTL